jgi:HEAT repeat protein
MIRRAVLDDPYPRVRMAAVTALAADADTLLHRATIARRDRWPMVRVAAVLTLGDPGVRRVLRAAVSDPAHAVRAAAIETLTAARDRGAAGGVARRLADEAEWPDVRSAAVAYVGAVCDRSAMETLVQIVERGLDPSAPGEEVALAAQTLPVLGGLGGALAERVIRRARAPRAPPALRRAATVPPVRCGAGPREG